MERMRILAVDDNATNLTTIEQELQETYEVITILTGRRALKFLYQETVDLVLLDVQMPIMDGIETLRQIRSLENGAGATLPVIFLTALKDKQTVIEGAKLGIMDYITKPFDGVDLRDRIAQVFMRLGKLEIPLDLLLHNVEETILAGKQGHDKVMLSKLDEMQSYQTDEEYHSRIRFIRLKHLDGDKDSAMKMLGRLRLILEKATGIEDNTTQGQISNDQLRCFVQTILRDLSQFKIQDAKEHFSELEQYDLPEQYFTDIMSVKHMLEEYDDVSAEQILSELLKSFGR